MLAKLSSLAAGKRAKEPNAPAKPASVTSTNPAGTPDNVVGLFELGDLQKIQAVLGEVDDPVYKDGKRPLHLASIYGHTHIAQWLLSEGAVVDAVDQGGHTPLHLASKYGHTQLMQLLLQHGAGVNAANRIYKMTPLHMAAKDGQRGSAEVLMQAGADVNAAAKDGVQPLHSCAEKGHREVAAVLIAAGAAPNTKDAIGFTPLHLAIEHKHDSMVALLLKLGADPDIPNKNGWTPLHVAAASGSTTATRALLEYGANVEATNSEGKTPLSLAVEQKHAAVVPLLNPAAAAALACPSLLAAAAAAGAAAEVPDGPLAPVRLPGDEMQSIDSLLGGLGLKESTGAVCPYCSSLGVQDGTRGTAAAGGAAGSGAPGRAQAAAPGSSSSGGGSSSSSGVPSLFLCPLSQRVLIDPVVACDGFTYDRRAVQEWFESGQRTSPLTKQQLRSTATLPNHVVRCAVNEWMEWRDKRAAQLQRNAQRMQ
ncbi:ankyrin repeat-containing domain protein [Scenedesmus sp. NREL 46B-D3]|nr:ankyrin repeat-containing domain protein [Scenedesmus sp. NREL 46B-D3]